MYSAGIGGLTEMDLIVNGQLQRFRPEGSRDKTAWYVLHEFTTNNNQTIIVGSFGDWREGDPKDGYVHKIEPDKAVFSDLDRERYKKQLTANKRNAEKKRKEVARRAALRAQRAWANNKLSSSGTSEYLTRKQVKGYGVKYSSSGALAIPLHDIGGELHGLQIIHPAGKERITKGGDKLDKEFWPFGASPRGHFHLIGNPLTEGEKLLRAVICEGYATGASIHEATGLPVYVAFNVGNLLPVAQAIRKLHPKTDIIIAADDDYLTHKPVNNPGKSTANKVAAKIKGRVALPKFKNRNGEKWTDFNDLHVTEGLDAVAHCFTSKQDDWTHKFSRTSQGNISADVNNVFLILENDTRWRGVLRYDRFTYDVIKIKMPPFEHNARVGEWTESDTTRLCIWCAQNYGFTPKENDALRAVLVAAEMLSYHPVLEYLHGLKWDGKPRMATWLHDFLGAKQEDYSELVGIKWLIGAVARAHAEPTKLIKNDTVLILEGGQGAGKSTAVAVLASPWGAETHFDLGSKDGYQQLRGKWIYEIAELDAFNKAESNKAKAFFSALEDNYRPSYGKKSSNFPRQCVFVGTTNQDQYLKDVTGNRRYWPIRCNAISLDALREARDQLWAEALHYYRLGTPWWVSPEERNIFHHEQENRFNGDAWEEDVQEYLYLPENLHINEITTSEILRDILKHSTPQIKPPEQTRVGLIMKRLNWAKKRTTRNKKQIWVYVRPENEVIHKINSDDSPL